MPVNSVFLDRDGVINENRPDHVKSWDEFRFIDGAPEAVVWLSQLGLRVFIISNQAVINRGIVPRSTIDDINDRMVVELERRGARIEEVAYCPHRPDEHCGCRKPQPGLLLDLARRHALDLCEAALVGDAVSDIEAGQAAGCTTVLVLTGRGREQLELAKAAGKGGFAVAKDLMSAVTLLRKSTFGAAPVLGGGVDRAARPRRSVTYRTDLVPAPQSLVVGSGVEVEAVRLPARRPADADVA